MEKNARHRPKRAYLFSIYAVTSLILLAGCARPVPRIPIGHPHPGPGLMEPIHGDLQTSYQVGAVQAQPRVAQFFGQLLAKELQRQPEEKNGGATDSEATGIASEPSYTVHAAIETSCSAMQLSDRFRAQDHAAIHFEIVDRKSGVLAKSLTWSHRAGHAPGSLSAVLSQWAHDFASRLHVNAVATTYPMSKGMSDYDAQGRQSVAAGNYQKALTQFRQAIDAHPADHTALYNAGLVCEAMGLHGRGLGFYRRARRLADNPEYQRALGRLEILVLTKKQ